MRRARAAGVRAIRIVSVLAMSTPVCAQDDGPNLDFLEYLGSWDEGDEPWYVEVQMQETEGAGTEDAGDDAPKELRAERDND